MARTVAEVRSGVRTYTRDRNAADSLLSPFEINHLIHGEAQRLFAEIGINPTWETGIVSVVSGTYEYTISVASGKANLSQVVALRLASRNWPIQRITDEQLESMRRGPSQASGFPLYAAIRESDSQTLKLRLWPTPNENDSIDWLRSWVPVWSTTTPDTDSIPLSDDAIRILEKRVAKAILSLLPDEQIAKRGISKEVVGLWDRDVAEGVRLERIRINSLKRTGMMARTQA